MSNRALSPKEKAFVELYTSGEKVSAKAAAREAGYTSKTAGSELMKRPHIKTAIEKVYSKRVNTFRVTQEQILERLWSEAQECEQGSTRIKALELLGKHFGLWKEDKTDTSDNSVTYNIVNYSSAPIEKQYEKEEKEVKAEVIEDGTPKGVTVQRYN